ncbi:MAG: mechanosensitive ion channel family protein [Phycisphaerales bacterium JB047]
MILQDTPDSLSTPETTAQNAAEQANNAAPGGASDPEFVLDLSGWPSWDSNANFFENIWAYVDHFWDLRLFTVGETEVFVNQLVVALFAFVFGVILSKLIARRVGKKILPRMKVHEGPASAIQTILYYFLLIITAVIALQIAQVPLTIFTIFGGALALGIGFGSQNIMNNFISGLILMLERPIQVNQIVTVNGETGKVLKIGARATHIQRYDGVTTIVPNSHLLENAVANWALPDPRIRSMIPVGVAYGSDVQLVKETLEKLLTDHIRVLESPDNRVLFMGFGDSSLDFEVHFWISPRSSFDRRQIESDLRFKIDALFREHDITIPFPQRDVHIFNETPVSVPDERTPQGDS